MALAATETTTGIEIADGADVLRTLLGRPRWHPDAACKDMDVAKFFPTRYEMNNDEHRAARRVCRGCPVRLECLEAGMVKYQSGIWGGSSDKERRRARRRGVTAAQLLAELEAKGR
jgi:WhiB family redox-sensing transcriptional regulator